MTLPLPSSTPTPVRCRRCHRVCRHGTVDGLGPECAVIEGVTPPRWPRRGRVVAADTQRNLMDLINEGDPMPIRKPTIYQIKPFDVQAMQWDPGDQEAASALFSWLVQAEVPHDVTGPGTVDALLHLSDSGQIAYPGDWVIRRHDGWTFTLDAESFARSYDLAAA